LGKTHFGLWFIVTESEPLSRLTPRERRCLELVALHYDTAQIAGELGISLTTVNGYLADARHKLGARNRKEAARMLAHVSSPSPVVASPPEIGGEFGRVEGETGADVPVSVQPNADLDPPRPKRDGWTRALYFDRPYQPHQFGKGARLGMIVALVVAFALAMALAVIAVVGLVSISTSLRS